MRRLQRLHPTPIYPEPLGLDLRDLELQNVIVLRDEQLAAARKEVSRLEAQIEDLRLDRNAWREQAQRKLLTWRGLFGGRAEGE